MRTLSIDPSLTNCGVVVWEDGLIYDFFSIQTDKALGEVGRIRFIIDSLKKTFLEEQIEEVTIESLSLGSISNSVRVLAGLYYSIKLLCEYYEIPCSEVTPLQLKKFATGSGKAKKTDMWKALPENIKSKIESKNKTISSGKYDICDAYWLGRFHLQNLK